MNAIIGQLIVVVIGGAVTGLCTAFLTGYWTSKKTALQLEYMQKSYDKLESLVIDHNKRIYSAETNIIVLQEQRKAR